MASRTYHHNKKTGVTYVYSVQSYWDKEKKAPRNRQVCLGRLDQATGEMMSLVHFIVQKGLPLSRSEPWSMGHLHPSGELLLSQRVSELLLKITEDSRQKFLSLWLDKMTEHDYLCYDITSVSSYARGNEYVKYGYNRDGEPLPQINLAMLFGQKSRLPAYYRRMQGNISDVATLKTTMKALDFLGAKAMHFVLNRGVYRAKDAVENSFDDLKNHLDMKRLSIHTAAAMDSRLFLQFLALILICQIRNTTQEDKVLRNLTVREVMEDMETLVRITYSGRYGQLYTETSPIQRKIMEVFGLTLPA